MKNLKTTKLKTLSLIQLKKIIGGTELIIAEPFPLPKEESGRHTPFKNR